MRKIVLFIVLVAVISACNDFLDVAPQGKLTEANKGSDWIDGLCTAAYSALGGPEDVEHAFYAPTTNWVYGDVRAETAYKGGGGVGDLWEFHAFETFEGVYSSNPLLDRKWWHLCISVQRCNNALRMINEVSEEDYPLKSVREGEMRFLRAHFFFEMSRLFNRIPYYDEKLPLEEYNTVSNVEFTRDEILEKLSSEFVAAAQLLPPTQSELGRVNKYAAYAYAAKANLYRAYKQDPATNQVMGAPDADLLKKVVEYCDSTAVGGYGLLKDFQQLSAVEYEHGAESVFGTEYSIDDGTDFGRINWSNLLNGPRGPAYGGDGFFQPSQTLVNSYKTDIATGLPLFDTYNASQDIKTAANGFTSSSRQYAVDPRLDFTVGRPGIRWKNFTESAYSGNWVRDNATYGATACKKNIVSPESPYMIKGWPWGGSALNFQNIRYADVLLWKAEALIELGRHTEALPLINQVRERAKNSQYVLKWDNTSNTDYAASYFIGLYEDGINCTWTPDFARQALRFERKLELALEGERFFDLVRWGIASQVLNDEYFPKEKSDRAYYRSSSFKAGRDEYFPIPQNQIDFSGRLYEQNSGYNEN
ncbi:MAG: RagB/SusD family nutrient uptake outer membrane protein [Candidatus Symbiothrix sp.]|jgi:tetratricopeptide (TPR) repeat protein|nr:RagB/SusD family nutrient uptake outer membrane protein [Candidatus Symbiothrix sp.]